MCLPALGKKESLPPGSIPHPLAGVAKLERRIWRGKHAGHGASGEARHLGVYASRGQVEVLFAQRLGHAHLMGKRFAPFVRPRAAGDFPMEAKRAKVPLGGVIRRRNMLSSETGCFPIRWPTLSRRILRRSLMPGGGAQVLGLRLPFAQDWEHRQGTEKT